jgi:hypothetical protein
MRLSWITVVDPSSDIVCTTGQPLASVGTGPPRPNTSSATPMSCPDWPVTGCHGAAAKYHDETPVSWSWLRVRNGPPGWTNYWPAISSSIAASTPVNWNRNESA